MTDERPLEWVAVTAGPLGGRELLLPVPLDGRGERVVAGTFEPHVFDALAAAVDLDGAVVWDVGAHQGYHALAFAAAVGQRGRVVAFEPHLPSLAVLRANLARAGEVGERVRVAPVALADHAGEAWFVGGPDAGWDSAGGHLAAVDPPEPDTAYAGFETATVTAAVADDLVADGRQPTPAAIKIDTEGAEHAVLLGATGLLAAVRPVLVVEVHSVVQMLRVQGLLHDHGYGVELLAPELATTSRCFVVATPT